MYSKFQKRAAAAVHFEHGASWRVTMQEVTKGVRYDLVFSSFSFLSCRWVEQFTHQIVADRRRSVAYKTGDALWQCVTDILGDEFPESVNVLRKRAARSRKGLVPFRFNLDLSQVVWQIRKLGLPDLVPQVVGGAKIALREAARRVTGAFSYALHHGEMLRWSIKKTDAGFATRMSTWLSSQVEKRERELLQRQARQRAFCAARTKAGRAAAQKRAEKVAAAAASFAARAAKKAEIRRQRAEARKQRRMIASLSFLQPWTAEEEAEVHLRYVSKLAEMRQQRRRKPAQVVWAVRRQVPDSPCWRVICVRQLRMRRYRLAKQFVGLNAVCNLFVLSRMLRYQFNADRAILPREQSKCNSRRRFMRQVGRLSARLCYVAPDYQVLPPLIEHQAGEQDPLNMDPVAETTQQRASNVAVIDQGAVSSVVSQSPVCYDSLVSEGREQQITSQMANRYALFDTFAWEATSLQGTLLQKYDFPYALCQRNFYNSPNFIMLKKWTYWHFDLDLRIQVNANRFQVGQLLVAWNYDMTDTRKRIGKLNEAVQAPHAIVSAPGNNVVELKIPFKWKYPYWSTDVNLLEASSTIRVNVFVMNALSVAQGVSSKCNVSILLRLSNVRVAGMRKQKVTVHAEHQMFSMLVKQAESMLRNVLADSNRDNPTNPAAHPVMIPYSSHSWSVGTNQVEHLNPLRLDPLGVTTHCETSDEMKVSYVARQFGFVGTFTWTTTDSTKAFLKGYAVMPMNICDLQVRYRDDVSRFQLAVYESTPLAVVSSLFSYWRGSIEFRFDFVASAFHTGRLAFCFVPGNGIPDDVTFDAAIQSYVQYFDLQTDTSFTFVCPYVSNRTWCSVLDPKGSFPKERSASECIGILLVFVINPLVVIDNVSSTVRINTFIRAGSDFEVAVPSFPVLYPETLNWNYIPVDDDLFVKSGYYPVYSGNWHNWFGSRRVILRYGPVSDHIAQFNPTYPSSKIFKSAESVVVYTTADKKSSLLCNYFVRADSGDGYMYLTPFSTYSAAKKYAANPSKEELLLQWYADGNYAWNKGQRLSPEDSVDIEAQAGDERQESHESCDFGIKNSLTSLVSFNEDFNDLKTLCRRYQLYYDSSVKLSTKIAFGETFLLVPLSPTGVYYDFANLKPGNLVLEFVNRARAGPIAVLANGYRFFRGGLRVKILFRSQEGKDLIIGVTHIPNRYYVDYPQEYKASNTLGYSPHGYAYYCQSTRMNECIELEIPYYLNTDFGLLGQAKVFSEVSDKLHSTLGNLAFSLMSRVDAQGLDLGIQIFYAFADDMRFSSFQGFSGVCSTLQIPERTPRAVTEIRSRSSTQLSQSSDSFEVVEPQMFGFDTRKEITEGITQGAMNATSILENSMLRAVGRAGDVVMDKVNYVIQELQKLLGAAFSGLRQIMCTIVSNLVHVITNPNRITICTATFSIVYAIFPFLASGASKLWSLYCRYLKWSLDILQPMIWGKDCEIIPYGQIVEPQFGGSSLTEALEFSKQYLILIASCLGFKMTKLTGSIPNFLGYVLINLPKLKMGVQGLVDFFQANIKMFYSGVDWVSRKMTGVGIEHYIYNYPNELKEFCANANLLLNPLNLQRIRTEPVLQRSVFRMATQGQQLLLAESSSTSSSRLSMHIRDLCVKLNQLQENLVNDCLSPMVKYDPFVLQLNGPPGIGKSELYQSLCYKLLEAINYTSYSEPMFTRTSGTQYWNGVNTQPCVYYDDFLFADSGELATACISEFMQLKSCATFNPSIAELENKKFRYSPLMVLLATNQAFWDVTFIKNHNALHRRRDRLYEVRMKKDWTMAKVKQRFSETGVKSYDHLEFAMWPDVLNSSRKPECWMEYSEFEHEITTFFRNYHSTQLKLYKARLNELDAAIPKVAGLKFDEHVEKEVLKWLAEEECRTNSLLTEEWRTKVREQCSTATTTLNGRDDALATLLAGLGSTAEPQAGEELEPLLNAEEGSVYEEATDRSDAPEEFRCIHWKELTVEYIYVHLQIENERFYHNVHTSKDIPESCTSHCWLTHESSEAFRLAYIKKHYEETLLNVDLFGAAERALVVAPFARSLFTQHLNEEIDEAVKDESRKSRYLSRIRALSWASCLETAKTVLKWFGILSGVLLSAFGMYSFVTDMIGLAKGGETPSADIVTTPDPWHIDHHYAPSGDNRVARKGLPKNWQKQAKIRSNVLKMKFARPEYNDTDPMTTFQNLLQKSAFEAWLEVDGVDRYGQKGFGLCGRVAIITKHFIEEFQFLSKTSSKVFLVYKCKNIRLRFKITDCKFTTLDESSLALIEFPKTMNLFRDLRHHIVAVDDLEYISCEGKVFEVTQGSYYVHSTVFNTEDSIEISGSEHISPQTLQMCYSYAFAGRGKCGSVLFVLKPTPKIIGFHVAGIANKNFGYAQAVFREMFEGLSAPGVAEIPVEPQAIEIEPKILLPDNTQQVAVLAPEVCPSQPRHSQIVQTLMFDQVFKHVTEPAVLSIHDRRVVIDSDVDPLVKAIQTHGNVPLSFDQEILAECVDDLSDFLIATTKPVLAFSEELLSDQVVFGGLPTGEGFKKLNLQSSEGYPLSLFRQYNTSETEYFLKDKQVKSQSRTGKNWLFKYSSSEKGVVLEEIHPELMELMKFNDSMRRQNNVPATIFVDTLKDSRVSREKIEKGKTRMFSISPVEFTWVIRKYFGVFQAAYQNARIDNGTAIGINVNSLEWTMLVRSLLSKGTNFVVGDYKAFGDTLQRDVMMGAFQAICNWYLHYFNSSEDTQKYRLVLIEELFNALHLATNVVYRMFCGIPSGFALTVEINDLVNQLYMRYCWRKCTKLPLSIYHKSVKVITYGDDLIMTVHSDLVEKFNFRIIQQCLSDYQIDFQPAAKDGSVYDVLSLGEVTFLKSHIVPHPIRPGLFLAKLPLESALDTLNWQIKSNDKVSILFENSRAALNNLFGHGPEVYKFWRKQIIIWFGQAVKDGLLPSRDGFIHLKTWKEIDDEIF
nr:polyprotein [Picornavirales sp.]